MNHWKDYIIKSFLDTKDKDRNFNNIRALFDLSYKGKYTIDDLTWDDLMMDDIFSEIDRTYSSAGEASLYSLLRNPLIDEEKLHERSSIISLFKEDTLLSGNLRFILFNMGFDSDNRLIEMIEGLLSVSKVKRYLYTLLGQILPPLMILLAIILKEPYFMFPFTILIYINIAINQKEITTVKATGLIYLRDLLTAARKISNIKNENIKNHKSKIDLLLSELNFIDNNTLLIKAVNGLGGFLQFLSVPFLIEETIYYKISGELINKEAKILELYYLIGEIDALISIASYKTSCNKWCTPKFTTETSLKIVDGIHPLLKKPISNSINISNKGIVLTGTNMSGKSTFIRMLSTNILLAQSLDFVFADEYEACFLNLVSSISPKDDIKSGKSYYMAEAESILRILKSLEDDIPVFCPIDEIFRGTNPVERIASSAEILNYINKRDALCIVATHDRELSDMLKYNYEFYYFSENINSNSGLSFDYKLKDGVSKTRNAIKLLEFVGYPNEITEAAFKRSELMDSTS